MGAVAPARTGCQVQAGGALLFWQKLPTVLESKCSHEPPEPQDGPGASAASPPEAGILTALMDSSSGSGTPHAGEHTPRGAVRALSTSYDTPLFAAGIEGENAICPRAAGRTILGGESYLGLWVTSCRKRVPRARPLWAQRGAELTGWG